MKKRYRNYVGRCQQVLKVVLKATKKNAVQNIRKKSLNKEQVGIGRHTKLTVCNSFASFLWFKAIWNSTAVMGPFLLMFNYQLLILIPQDVN